MESHEPGDRLAVRRATEPRALTRSLPLCAGWLSRVVRGLSALQDSPPWLSSKAGGFALGPLQSGLGHPGGHAPPDSEPRLKQRGAAPPKIPAATRSSPWGRRSLSQWPLGAGSGSYFSRNPVSPRGWGLCSPSSGGIPVLAPLLGRSWEATPDSSKSLYQRGAPGSRGKAPKVASRPPSLGLPRLRVLWGEVSIS